MHHTRTSIVTQWWAVQSLDFSVLGLKSTCRTAWTELRTWAGRTWLGPSPWWLDYEFWIWIPISVRLLFFQANNWFDAQKYWPGIGWCMPVDEFLTFYALCYSVRFTNPPAVFVRKCKIMMVAISMVATLLKDFERAPFSKIYWTEIRRVVRRKTC